MVDPDLVLELEMKLLELRRANGAASSEAIVSKAAPASCCEGTLPLFSQNGIDLGHQLSRPRIPLAEYEVICHVGNYADMQG
jgi:hypothetical protein